MILLLTTELAYHAFEEEDFYKRSSKPLKIVFYNISIPGNHSDLLMWMMVEVVCGSVIVRG